MPRLATKKAAPKKIVRRRKTAVDAAKVLAGEPRLIMPSNLQLVQALNWYSVNSDPETCQSWAVAYARSINADERVVKALEAKGKKFSPTMAAVARMLSRGCQLEDKHVLMLSAEMRKFADMRLDDEEPVVPPVKSKKKSSALEEIDDYVDTCLRQLLSGVKISPDAYAFALRAGCTPTIAREVKLAYERTYEEIKLALEGDEEMEEGYSGYSKKHLRSAREFLQQLRVDMVNIGKVTKVKRGTRKRRAPSKEKAVSRVKYMEKSPEYGVASINPADIIGAASLWVFNNKTRQLGVYFASGADGLSIKGTTIQGYDEEKSFQRKLRKPEAYLEAIRSSTPKSALEKLKSVRAVDVKMNGRINDQTILLRASSR